MLPKISIITPSYNQGQFLEATILSVLGQQYPNLEYIIMDGGSTDDSVAIIKKYASQLTYWSSEKDDGQAFAINAGFTKATGEIFMWLNSDDMLMPNVLQDMASLYQTEGDKIYIGNAIHFEMLSSGNLSTRGSQVFSKHENVPLKLVDYIIQPSSFWTRKVWETVGALTTDFTYVFDWHWFLRASEKGIPFYNIRTPLSMYRIHSDHKSGTGGIKRQQEIKQIYQNFAPTYKALYENICSESLYEKTYFKRGVEFWSIFDPSEKVAAKLLKRCKPRKYRNFSVKEIHYIRQMI